RPGPGVRPRGPGTAAPPADTIRAHVRFTLQPVDAPPGDPHKLARTLEHIGGDRLLLFSTDFPHWHFDGDAVLPQSLPEAIMRKMMVKNPLDTYPRLRAADPAAPTSQSDEPVEAPPSLRSSPRRRGPLRSGPGGPSAPRPA